MHLQPKNKQHMRYTSTNASHPWMHDTRASPSASPINHCTSTRHTCVSRKHTCLCLKSLISAKFPWQNFLGCCCVGGCGDRSLDEPITIDHNNTHVAQSIKKDSTPLDLTPKCASHCAYFSFLWARSPGIVWMVIIRMRQETSWHKQKHNKIMPIFLSAGEKLILSKFIVNFIQHDISNVFINLQAAKSFNLKSYNL